MKALITGAGGMLAKDLTALLKARERDFVALNRASLDIADSAMVARVLDIERPRMVFNCAAYTKVDLAEKEKTEAMRVNATGPGTLASACTERGIRLIHVSTDFVFDGTARAPYREDAPTAPLGEYGASKLAGEQAVTAAGAEHLIVRTSWLHGVSGGNFVKTMLRLGAERELLGVVADQTGSPTWSADLAQGLLELSDRGQSGIFNYSNSGSCTWHALATASLEIAVELGMVARMPVVKPIATSDYPTPAKRPAYSVLDTAKFSRAVGHVPPPWRDALRAMLHQLRDQSSAPPIAG